MTTKTLTAFGVCSTQTHRHTHTHTHMHTHTHTHTPLCTPLQGCAESTVCLGDRGCPRGRTPLPRRVYGASPVECWHGEGVQTDHSESEYLTSTWFRFVPNTNACAWAGVSPLLFLGAEQTRAHVSACTAVVSRRHCCAWGGVLCHLPSDCWGQRQQGKLTVIHAMNCCETLLGFNLHEMKK